MSQSDIMDFLVRHKGQKFSVEEMVIHNPSWNKGSILVNIKQLRRYRLLHYENTHKDKLNNRRPTFVYWVE